MRLAVTVTLVAALVLAIGCGDDEETTTETITAPTATGPTGEQLEQAEPPAEKQDDQGASSAQSSGSGGSTPSDILEAFFTSGDPDLACGELATDKLLSDAYGDEKGCRQAQVPAATPDSIEIEGLDESGDEATATVIPNGGPNDGIETHVTLVQAGGAWRVDSLKADVPAGP